MKAHTQMKSKNTQKTSHESRSLEAILTHGFATVLAVSFITTLLAGCGVASNGFNSDPLASNAKYQEMERKGVPSSGLQKLTPPPAPPAPPAPKINTQIYANVVFPEPDLGDQVLNFSEGETSTYQMNIRVLQPGMKYTISAQGLPSGATFKQVKQDLYEISWTPRIGAAQGKQKLDSKFSVVLNVTDAGSPEAAEIMKFQTKEHTVRFSIIASGKSLPLIDKVHVAADKVEEGSKVAFSILVKDPVSQSRNSVPDIAIVADSSSSTNERAILPNATQYVHVNPQGRAVDGGFEFDGYLDTAGVSMPEKAQEMDAHFAIVATNAANQSSPKKLEVITITRKAAAPVEAAPVEPKPVLPAVPAAPVKLTPAAPKAPVKPVVPVKSLGEKKVHGSTHVKTSHSHGQATSTKTKSIGKSKSKTSSSTPKSAAHAGATTGSTTSTKGAPSPSAASPTSPAAESAKPATQAPSAPAASSVGGDK